MKSMDEEILKIVTEKLKKTGPRSWILKAGTRNQIKKHT